MLRHLKLVRDLTDGAERGGGLRLPSGRRRIEELRHGKLRRRLRRGAGAAQGGIDLVLEDVRRAKHQHAARLDRDLHPGLRVTPYALPFLAHREAPEGRDLHDLAASERVGNLVQYGLDQHRRLVAREPYLLIDGLTELRARYSLP